MEGDSHELGGLRPYVSSMTEITYWWIHLERQSSYRTQSSSTFFGFIFKASSFISPQTCSVIFTSSDLAGQSWSTFTFFTLRSFDEETQVWEVEPYCCGTFPLLECGMESAAGISWYFRLLMLLSTWQISPTTTLGVPPNQPDMTVSLCHWSMWFHGSWDPVQRMIHQKNQPPPSVLSENSGPWPMQQGVFSCPLLVQSWRPPRETDKLSL